MSIIDDIIRKYDTFDDEEWDEETQKNWDEKMSDPAIHHPNPHDDTKGKTNRLE